VGQLILIIPSGETDKSRGTEIFVVRGANDPSIIARE
jgi:hypothetical protein